MLTRTKVDHNFLGVELLNDVTANIFSAFGFSVSPASCSLAPGHVNETDSLYFWVVALVCVGQERPNILSFT